MEDITEMIYSPKNITNDIEVYQKSLDKLDISEPSGKCISCKKFLIKVFRVFEKIGNYLACCLGITDLKYQSAANFKWQEEENEKRKKKKLQNTI